MTLKQYWQRPSDYRRYVAEKRMARLRRGVLQRNEREHVAHLRIVAARVFPNPELEPEFIEALDRERRRQ